MRLNLTHQDIANLTATTRQTLTSTFNKLERNCSITYNRRKILIRKPEELL
ncbi:helix-turn-helix domain-containing protein [Labilibaculum manganireducens]|uniref:helix-turn-helix domain-containing protein n=1 Tax=Labilibaculum manganireducens TaxID=1940525 RepID=UPI0037495177